MPRGWRSKPGDPMRKHTRRRYVGELALGVGYAPPYCLAVVIVLRRKFIGAREAFLDGIVALSPEH